MSSYDNEGRVSLWSRKQKGKDDNPNYPVFTGELTVNGVLCNISVWENDRFQDNKKAPRLTGKVEPRDQEAASRPASGIYDDDDIPFNQVAA